MYTILSGTNRPGSNTLKIAQLYQRRLAARGIDARLVSLENLDVSTRSAGICALENEVLIPSEKFIFVVPEYNGSFPGVLKSLFDNSDIEKVWRGKKALLTGVSTGRAGNLRGMEHLTGILHYLKTVVHPNKLPISVVNTLLTADNDVTDAVTLKVIDQQLDEFIAF
ncbi:MAG: NAD(P)H-dependent oxidoreductase [Flavihumibacter sp.]